MAEIGLDNRFRRSVGMEYVGKRKTYCLQRTNTVQGEAQAVFYLIEVYIWREEILAFLCVYRFNKLGNIGRMWYNHWNDWSHDTQYNNKLNINELSPLPQTSVSSCIYDLKQQLWNVLCNDFSNSASVYTTPFLAGYILRGAEREMQGTEHA